jgi:ubiquinone/menaquinone biosynthesis C-methylase UbiE
MTSAELPRRHQDTIAREVLRMYMQHPYPSYSAAERRAIFPAELSRYRYLGLEPFLPNARIIDVGCGTGHRVMPMAQHFGVSEYVGFDHSSQSLEVARALAAQLGFRRVTLAEGDLFSLPFPDASFDVVVSQGVLHHTSDPLRGFRELVRVCKPGGFVAIYLYNKFNHWRHNLQKTRVSRLGGNDFERRFQIAYGLYGTRPLSQMSPADIAGFYDQYCHPHKSDHTVGETLAWFEDEGFEYWGSYPPLGFKDFLGMAQFRGDLARDYPGYHTRIAEAIVGIAMMAPRVAAPTPPFRYPTAWHRFVWQLVYAIQGSGGKYSGGPALCGRKALR